jgi:hypothetical protein
MKMRIAIFAACVSIIVSAKAGAQNDGGSAVPKSTAAAVGNEMLFAQAGGMSGGMMGGGMMGGGNRQFRCGHGFDKCHRLGYSIEQMSAPGWCASHFVKDKNGVLRHRCPPKWGVKNAKPYPFDN